jgi:hypothetical protein
VRLENFKWLLFGAGFVLLAGPSQLKAQFGIGADIAYLIQILRQAEQMYQLEQQTQLIIQQEAAFFRSGNYLAMITGLGSIADAEYTQYQNGGWEATDIGMMGKSVKTAAAAIKGSAGSAQRVMTTSDAALAAMAQMNAVAMKIRMDQMMAGSLYLQGVQMYSQQIGYDMGPMPVGLHWQVK